VSKENRPKIFAECMAELGAAFGKNIDEVVMRVYWKILGEFTEEQIRKGFDQVLRVEKFWPAPGVIREYAATAAKNARKIYE
jgi:hypothetical protein